MISPSSSRAQMIPASYRTQGFDAKIEEHVACSTAGFSIIIWWIFCFPKINDLFTHGIILNRLADAVLLLIIVVVRS